MVKEPAIKWCWCTDFRTTVGFVVPSVIGFNRDMEPLFATSTQSDLLLALGGMGILIGSWFFGRFITAVWRNNPLVWKGGSKKEESE